VTAYGPWVGAPVVLLKVDADKDDPVRFFKLDSPDFADCGLRIGPMGLPTVFVMEGGSAIKPVRVNTVYVLEGYQNP
jgi:acetoin utilization deacetylase AcuC-like enzyme